MSPAIIDSISMRLQTECLASGVKCHYVDGRALWTPEEATPAILFDSYHVSREAAPLFATAIWDTLISVDAYR